MTDQEKKTDSRKKDGRGRPATGRTTTMIRVRRSDVETLDKWASRQPDKPSRSDALSRAIAKLG